ncbi:PEPxxWA-CTERM sorting domain-containing protein [Phenylobacterium sp. Root700]|uniref:PEPxxWA-CTERM sorting domain-containing protein n=1 Tax=Phenylobacterium sp. Root700 TaxID=1736591 RepID=UPI000A8CC5E3|nr:PEPxxWA-CTERM sorting domain-containing protein [Phenylobacterium sp. Root700]
MRTLRRLAFTVIAAAAFASPAAAAVTHVVNFDDLPGAGVLADGYGGVNWNSDFTYDSVPYPGFPAASGLGKVYANYAKHRPPGTGFMIMNFLGGDVQFNGASFSGSASPLRFDLYLDGRKVGSSMEATSSPTATFLASGYGGLVDEVRLFGSHGNWVMDDFTYTTGISSAVPEPAAWAMMIIGFGAAGTMVRSARRRMAIA